MKTFNVFKDVIEYSKQNPSETIEYKWFYDDSSILYKQCFYKNNNIHGECKWYYKDGTPQAHGFYLNGDLHGEYKWFYYDGTLDEHRFYLNNEYQPQLDYLITDRDETTLTLLFGDNYI